jgi:DNA-binding transcriptional MerR regulator
MAAQRSEEMTIDVLARETGMTVRNIRAHQSRGLLPPPEVRARTGYYGPEHVARLRLIQDMQGEGFNLKAIERLIAAGEGTGQQLIDFGRAALTAFGAEEPETTTLEELRTRIGTSDARAIRKAERLGLIRPLGGDRYEVPSPTLLRAGEELTSMGVPTMHALAVAEQIQRHSRAIADSFVRLFIEDVAHGQVGPKRRTPEEWEELSAAFDRLRPLATEAVRAGFEQTMSDAIEKQLARVLRG